MKKPPVVRLQASQPGAVRMLLAQVDAGMTTSQPK
jgi:P pilus assembly chaperone PapD